VIPSVNTYKKLNINKHLPTIKNIIYSYLKKKQWCSVHQFNLKNVTKIDSPYIGSFHLWKIKIIRLFINKTKKTQNKITKTFFRP